MKIDRAFKTIFISISSIFLTVNSATAQLIPDRSLGNESSVVVPVSNTRDNISGGARRGSNLFHSFREFNVNTNREVYFNNPSGVRNIINRVTGSNISNIFGTLGVDGNANLYLINPNGIVFGDGAFLDINGTFIGTTADGVRLGANDVYSASDPASSSLLTIQPGALFVNRKNAQIRAIRNQGNLEVKQGSNLTLSADEINNSGSITNPGGNVFLEAVNGDINTGNIDVSSPLVNDISTGNGGDIDLVSSGNINVLDGSFIATEGILGGSINIESQGEIRVNNGRIESNSTGNIIGNAGNVNIKTDSLRLLNGAEISSDSFVRGNSGNLNISARSIELIGTSFDGFLSSGLFTFSSEGNAGNITINTSQLRLVDGAQIFSSSFSEGTRGNLNISAESIELIGPSGLSTFSSEGNGGNITINTSQLRLVDGAQIFSSSSISEGTRGGNLNISARSIELIGKSIDGFPSGLFTFIFEGNAGNITINTSQLRLVDGAQISIISFSEGTRGGNLNITAGSIELIGGNSIDGSPSLLATQTTTNTDAGNIILNTDFLRIVDGAAISTATFAEGNAGNITISGLTGSAEKIEIIGVNSLSGSPSGLFSSATEDLTSDRTGNGNGGKITVNTKQLNILDGGIIDSSNFQSRIFLRSQNGVITVLDNDAPGLGEAGEIEIKASEVLLNRGRITANGNIRGGGNITIDSSNFISLENESEISTDVGETRDFPGGNINIDTPLIIANPDNNKITATAVTSQGGNININTNAIFGYPQFLSIDASSDRSIDGTISITGIIDLNSDILPAEPVTITTTPPQLAKCPIQGQSTEVNSAYDYGTGEKIKLELFRRKNSDPEAEQQQQPESKPKPSKPAVGWYRKTDGTVVLTDNPAKVRPLNQPIDYPTGCGN